MRRLFMPFLFFFLLLFSGCSSHQTEVPEALIDSEISSIIQYDESVSNIYNSENTISTDWSVLHTPDIKAHLDTLEIDINFHRPAGTIVYHTMMVYQYEKDSDSWDQIRSDPLEFKEAVLDVEALEGTCINNQDTEAYPGGSWLSGKGEYQWDLTISDIDLEEQSAVITYSIDYAGYYHGDPDDSIGPFSWEDTQTFYADDNKPLISSVHRRSLEHEAGFSLEIPCPIYDKYDNLHDYVIVVQISVNGINSFLTEFQ